MASNRDNGRKSSRDSLASMQNIVTNQEAAAEQIKSAANELTIAATMLTNMLAKQDPMGYGGFGGGGSGGTRGSSDPNGRRPVIGDNQTSRPYHGHGLTGIRNTIAQGIHNRFGAGSTSTFHEVNGGHVETMADGTRRFRQSGTDDAVTPDELAAGARAGRISNIAGAFGGGGAMGAMKAVPYVGVAMEAGHEVLTHIGDQRAKNAQYQSIFGGDNAGTGFSNRIHQTGFRLREMFSGGLTGHMADQAFQGVSALGFQGSQRNQDLNFISKNYKSMGMDVSESLKLITIASQDANKNLVGLASSLKQVSDTAVATGQNAAVGRQNYMQNYAVLGKAYPGAGASNLSGAVGNMQTNLGRLMQGNVDFTGALSGTRATAELGSKTGQSVGQIEGHIMAGDSEMYNYLNMQTGAAMGNAGVSPQANAFIMQRYQQDKPTRANADEWAKSVAQDLLTQGMVSNPATVSAAYKAQGITFTNDTYALIYYIQNKVGIGNVDTTSKKQDVTKGDHTTTTSAGTAGKGGAEVSTSSTKASDVGKRDLNAKGVNPVIDDAKSALKDQKIIVDTPGGQRVVSMDVATKYYGDQIAKGTATVADTGEKVAQALGETQDWDYGKTGTQDSSKTNFQKQGPGGGSGDVNDQRGESVDAYQKDKGNGTGGNAPAGNVSGTITVVPGPALMGLLGFYPSNDNITVANQGAAVGGVPVK